MYSAGNEDKCDDMRLGHFWIETSSPRRLQGAGKWDAAKNPMSVLQAGQARHLRQGKDGAKTKSKRGHDSEDKVCMEITIPWTNTQASQTIRSSD